MPVKLLRQVFIALIMTAYVGATMFQVAPTFGASTQTHGAGVSGMTHDQDHSGGNMPCKGMLPGCVSDLGCIFLIGLPAPDFTVVTVTAWSSVSYAPASQGLRGRTIKSALGPPIPLA